MTVPEFTLNTKTADRLIDCISSDGDGPVVIAKKWLRNFRREPNEANKQAALRFLGELDDDSLIALIRQAGLT